MWNSTCSQSCFPEYKICPGVASNLHSRNQVGLSMSQIPNVFKIDKFDASLFCAPLSPAYFREIKGDSVFELFCMKIKVCLHERTNEHMKRCFLSLIHLPTSTYLPNAYDHEIQIILFKPNINIFGVHKISLALWRSLKKWGISNTRRHIILLSDDIIFEKFPQKLGHK